MIIPIGVNAAKGLEINFTAEILNLPPDLKVYLEDKENNTYTRLGGTNSMVSQFAPAFSLKTC